MKRQKARPLTPDQIRSLWRQADHRQAAADDERIEDDGQDRWILDLNDQEAKRLRNGNPYLWRQLVDRGFIHDDGTPSRAWTKHPGNRPMRRDARPRIDGMVGVVWRSGRWVKVSG